MGNAAKVETTQRHKARRIAREANRQRRCAEARKVAEAAGRKIWRHRGQDICRVIRKAVHP
jgi:hypothetical protein